jgi:hypothetical protein
MIKKIIIVLLLTILTAGAARAINQALLLKLLELERESYLSKRGEINLDLTPAYTQDSLLVPWALTQSSLYSCGIGLRVGLSNRVELSLRQPYYYESKKTYTGSWSKMSGSGWGDTSLSLQLQILPESYNNPSTYLNFGASLPTARSQFSGLAPSEIAFGTGYFSCSTGLSFIKSIDPTVLYCGFDYQTNIKRDGYDPADTFSYNGGIGVAINQAVNLSFGLGGAVVGDDAIFGPAYQRAAASIGATIIIDNDFYLSPLLSIGLTPEENDYAFTFSLTRKLKGAE